MSHKLTLCLYIAIYHNAIVNSNVCPSMGYERCKKADSLIAKPTANIKQKHWTTWGDPQEFRCNGHVLPYPAAE